MREERKQAAWRGSSPTSLQTAPTKPHSGKSMPGWYVANVDTLQRVLQTVYVFPLKLSHILLPRLNRDMSVLSPTIIITLHTSDIKKQKRG